MSRLTCTAPAGGSIKDAANIDWNKVDIDELVDQLSPDEIQQLLEECDPDDPHLPPSARCTYHCDKLPTGNHLHKFQLLNCPVILLMHHQLKFSNLHIIKNNFIFQVL